MNEESKTDGESVAVMIMMIMMTVSVRQKMRRKEKLKHFMAQSYVKRWRTMSSP